MEMYEGRMEEATNEHSKEIEKTVGIFTGLFQAISKLKPSEEKSNLLVEIIKIKEKTKANKYLKSINEILNKLGEQNEEDKGNVNIN